MARQPKLRGITLLGEIFGEIYSQLEGIEDVDPEDLLLAAQELIALSKREYVTNKHPDPRSPVEYYSCEVDAAFRSFQGRIWENEAKTMDDPLTNETPEFLSEQERFLKKT